MEDFVQLNIKSCFIENKIFAQPIIKYKNNTHKKGDGYSGILERAAITGEGKVINIVTKRAITNNAVRKDILVRGLYLNEMTFYNVIIPSFDKFMASSNMNSSFITFTICYGVNKTEFQEMLVLEDLSCHGFTLWDRTISMNSEHIEFILNEYSKFHSVSYAFKEKQLGEYNMVSKQLDQGFLKFMEAPGFAVFDICINEAKNVFNVNTESEQYEFFNHFAENYREYFSSTLKNIDDNSIIIHGDCWCNNMLFKYKGNKELESMRFIDFQFATIGSPMMDISYFLFTNLNSNNLDRLEYYLMVYYTALENNLKRLNCTVKISPSEFRQQWKQYHHYGLILAIPVLKIMLTESEEAVDMNQCDDVTTCFNYVGKNESEYQNRWKSLLNFYYKNQHLF